MKTIEQLLRNLERADIAEIAIISNRMPSARIGSASHPLDDKVLSADTILEMLCSVGGSRHVDDLGPTPKHWTSRLEGVGIVSASAVMVGNEVQARFSLSRRDPRAATNEKTKGPIIVEVKRKLSIHPTQRSIRAEPRRMSREKVAAVRSAPPVKERSVPPPRRSTAPKRTSITPESRRSSGPPKSRRSTNPAASRRSSTPAASRRSSTPAARRRSSTPAASRGSSGPPSARKRSSVPARKRSAPPSIRTRATSPGLRISLAPAPPRGAPEPSVTASPRPSKRRSTGEIDSYLLTARSECASDLHIVAGRPLLLRIGGELRPQGDSISAEAVENALLELVPERLAGALNAHGSCDFALERGKLGRFRVNVSRQQTGLKACFRLIPDETPTLESLGLPAAISQGTRHHQGLVLVTGPTGHGKTSTLAALVDLLNRETTHHIITVEDPIEHVHARKKALMSQREIGTHTASFASALKAALREDPDVIVVGELRDTETVRMAVAASETGHLVLGTMNTPSAAKTIDRLIDLFPPADQPQVRLTLAAGLRLIVSQRLVPSVDGTRLFAATELLPASIPLSALMREGKTYQIPSLQQRSKALGIVRLDDSLAELARSHRVSFEAAKALAESPGDFEMLVGQMGMARPAPDARPFARRDG